VRECQVPIVATTARGIVAKPRVRSQGASSVRGPGRRGVRPRLWPLALVSPVYPAAGDGIAENAAAAQRRCESLFQSQDWRCSLEIESGSPGLERAMSGSKSLSSMRAAASALRAIIMISELR
jgi:hypothetical protein